MTQMKYIFFYTNDTKKLNVHETNEVKKKLLEGIPLPPLHHMASSLWSPCWEILTMPLFAWGLDNFCVFLCPSPFARPVHISNTEPSAFLPGYDLKSRVGRCFRVITVLESEYALAMRKVRPLMTLNHDKQVAWLLSLLLIKAMSVKNKWMSNKWMFSWFYFTCRHQNVFECNFLSGRHFRFTPYH